MASDGQELKSVYAHRFAGRLAYRNAVWNELCRSYFTRFIGGQSVVLDLGCGYGEFINNISCGKKLAMYLNPDARKYLRPDVTLLEQDCSSPWKIPDGSLDVVFTSNFLEHLPNKSAIRRTLQEAVRCLKAGGLFIAIGPNIKFLTGAYWDFWDHHVPLTEASLVEGLTSCQLTPTLIIKKFLPYTMSKGARVPILLIRLYIYLRPVWNFVGKQFLIVARKEARSDQANTTSPHESIPRD